MDDQELERRLDEIRVRRVELEKEIKDQGVDVQQLQSQLDGAIADLADAESALDALHAENNTLDKERQQILMQLGKVPVPGQMALEL